MSGYRIFWRTWYTRNPEYPGGCEPVPGKKHYVRGAEGYADTEEEAHVKCKKLDAAARWTPEQRKLSAKHEYEEA